MYFYVCTDLLLLPGKKGNEMVFTYCHLYVKTIRLECHIHYPAIHHILIHIPLYWLGMIRFEHQYNFLTFGLRLADLVTMEYPLRSHHLQRRGFLYHSLQLIVQTQKTSQP